MILDLRRAATTSYAASATVRIRAPSPMTSCSGMPQPSSPSATILLCWEHVALDLDVWGNVRSSLTALNALWKPEHAKLAHMQKRKAELAAPEQDAAGEQAEQAAKLSKDKPIHPVFLGNAMARNSRRIRSSFGEFPRLRASAPLRLRRQRLAHDTHLRRQPGLGPGASIGAQLARRTARSY